METVAQKEADALAAARAKAATRIAAAQRGRKARKEQREREAAATRLQAVQRGRVTRRERFVVAEASHAAAVPSTVGRGGAKGASLVPTVRPLTMKQLGLPTGLPSDPVPKVVSR